MKHLNALLAAAGLLLAIQAFLTTYLKPDPWAGRPLIIQPRPAGSVSSAQGPAMTLPRRSKPSGRRGTPPPQQSETSPSSATSREPAVSFPSAGPAAGRESSSKNSPTVRTVGGAVQPRASGNSGGRRPAGRSRFFSSRPQTKSPSTRPRQDRLLSTRAAQERKRKAREAQKRRRPPVQGSMPNRRPPR